MPRVAELMIREVVTIWPNTLVEWLLGASQAVGSQPWSSWRLWFRRSSLPAPPYHGP